MRILVLVVLALIGCGSCKQENPDYCPTGDCDDGGAACTVSQGTCVCLNKTCVECTKDDTRNCEGIRPACGDDNKCRACKANDECPAGSACLETGACADPAHVIAVSPTGANTSPCGAMGQQPCSITQALVEVNAPRDIIRLDLGMYTVSGTNGLDFNTKNATLVARDATIRNLDGAILSATNNRTLKLIGGTLQGPNNSVGLRCGLGGTLLVYETTIRGMTLSGIETDSCPLTVSRATIRDNLRGGINMLNTPRIATITNNFVYLNGGGTSPVGGMSVRLAAGSKLEFNTVVSNTAMAADNLAGGIVCDGNGYDAKYNLIYRNRGGLDDTVQIDGTCTFQGSYSQFAMVNDNAVGFEMPSGANPSFRLTVNSPINQIRDAFDCSNVVDFDGELRPIEGKCDFGADEFRMPPPR